MENRRRGKCWPQPPTGILRRRLWRPAGQRLLYPADRLFDHIRAYAPIMVGDTPPTKICDVFDTEAYPGKRAHGKASYQQHEWALLVTALPKDEVYDVLGNPRRVKREGSASSNHQGRRIWWSAVPYDTAVAMANLSWDRPTTPSVQPSREQGPARLPMLWDAQAVRP